ncbi:hypothetical protein NC652_040122 [Populus alba x Populus x berolinensis]|nr:hypothetical protein NC652_040122 [Populus alba x Populus x berolinensis]
MFLHLGLFMQITYDHSVHVVRLSAWMVSMHDLG